MTVAHGKNIVDFEIEKDFDESLGLEFESDNLEIKTCFNHCIFCFIDQMPKGMRDTLYVKDDDYRQSFLCGNYVTMTNVTDSDIERICRLHLSPLYISVHATDGETRKKMLNNRFADKILDYIKRLDDAGIEMHTQVVLVKGVNDGEILQKTMRDLSSFENVKSLAVVPCGITAHREGLFPISDIDQNYAREIVEVIRSFNKKLGRNFVLSADEFFVRAGLETEKSEFYGDFSQLENGVGMFRAFEDEFNETARKTCYRRTFLIVTGVSAKPFIEKYAKKTEEFVSGLKVFVVAAKNNFFGDSVTCTGLLTGGDVLSAAKSFEKDFDELVISDVMLKDGEKIFIDDMTVPELSEKLGKPVRVSHSGGTDFFLSLSSDR
jgi:putative radical SAM enzyme (TIGR03279 family)